MKTYKKRLHRSQDNKVIAGVMGGIGVYFDIDPVMIRVAYIIITVFTGLLPGIISYVFMVLVIPKEIEIVSEKKESQREKL